MAGPGSSHGTPDGPHHARVAGGASRSTACRRVTRSFRGQAERSRRPGGTAKRGSGIQLPGAGVDDLTANSSWCLLRPHPARAWKDGSIVVGQRARRATPPPSRRSSGQHLSPAITTGGSSTAGASYALCVPSFSPTAAHELGGPLRPVLPFGQASRRASAPQLVPVRGDAADPLDPGCIAGSARPAVPPTVHRGAVPPPRCRAAGPNAAAA